MPNAIRLERTAKLLELLSSTPNLSQRDLAQATNLSLGLINLTLKRLIQTGHLKVSNLNPKKFEYLLTPKGMLEKSRKTYAYISKTINVYGEYQKRLEKLVLHLFKSGYSEFGIAGSGEIATLMEIAFRSSGVSAHCRRLQTNDNAKPGEIVLDCRSDAQGGTFGISVPAWLLQKRLTDSPAIKEHL